METTQIPFCIDGLYGGCAKIDGLVKAGPEQLTLEYRMTDNLLGAWKGNIVTRTVAFRELESAEYRGAWFSTALVLTARSMELFGKLPMSGPAQITLSVPRKHRPQLRAVASEINLYLSYQAADRHRARLEGI